jgi:hypothetical protein
MEWALPGLHIRKTRSSNLGSNFIGVLPCESLEGTFPDPKNLGQGRT